jgi:hypothetical protein
MTDYGRALEELAELDQEAAHHEGESDFLKAALVARAYGRLRHELQEAGVEVPPSIRLEA